MTGRPVARALLAGGLLLTLLLAGCGVRPSGVITGRPAMAGPSVGVRLYLLSHGELALVIHPSKEPASPEETLAMLAAGPDESDLSQGLTSEVPTGLVPAGPVTAVPGRPGLTVTMTGPVLSLSGAAADQIVCTAASAAALAGLADSFPPITLAGPDGARPPRFCPVVR
ncbi:hypothetical protein M8C17_05605 [Micromonospora sp. RHAY321]|uniref:hypothetical protein n=1 Tax=Micromonospora sp. RHAY321 TaxID=2944807 RepID=UPI00207CA1C5|nr:hypothetical protein [Micromonospora sp. RHAY321]MCO1594636.1 hypothetical protein [Micromonospora sp. RHAY321]